MTISKNQFSVAKSPESDYNSGQCEFRISKTKNKIDNFSYPMAGQLKLKSVEKYPVSDEFIQRHLDSRKCYSIF